MKTVLFTGATGGLGSLCVKALSESGRWTVFAAGTNDEALARLASLPRVVPLHMDITDGNSITAALDAVAAAADSLDAIVNFAGLSSFASLVEGNSPEEVQRLLDVNVMGMVRVNRTFFELLLRGRGRIINCSSESGWMTPQPFAGPYVVSKHAVEAYNDSLRRELMFLGISVIKVQPGSYETRLTGQVFRDFDRALSETDHYKDVLSKMKPLMAMELVQKNDPQKLVQTVLKALEAKHPRLRYRVGTGRMLALLELLPEGGVDAVYRTLFRFLGRNKNKPS